MTDNLPETQSDILIYQSEDGQTRIDVRLIDGTVWLTQKLMAELFQVKIPTINEHLKNIFNDLELKRESVIRKFRIVQKEGKRNVERLIDFYNLDVILSIGYRVRSHRGTQFRIWAIHGHTAAELISRRADANKPDMGLTAWKGGIVRKGDVGIAKNYLTEQEISDLNLIINQYLDFAEFQARRHQPMHMKDWAQRLDDFLQVNRLNILETAGKITAQQAKELAETEYEKFTDRRRLEQDQVQSDFDKMVQQIEDKNRKENNIKDID